MEAPKKHALLSASSSHRWMRCTPSAVRESKYPDKRSEYATEGSMAHAVAASMIKRHLGIDDTEEQQEIARDKWEFGRERFEQITREVEPYVSHVLEVFENAKDEDPDAKIFIEQEVDFSFFVPEAFGTADAVVIRKGRVDILDLKFGKGVKVDATDNTQLKLYALGVLDRWDYAYALEDVCLTIVQPRIRHFSEWSCSSEQLTVWAETELFWLSHLAFAGLGAPYAGEWCRFCRAKEDCATHKMWAGSKPPTSDFENIEFK